VQENIERKEEEMVHRALAYAGLGPIELLVIVLVFGIPVLVFVLIVRAVLRNRKENIRLRLEVGKLADELEQERKKSQGEQENNSSRQSG